MNFVRFGILSEHTLLFLAKQDNMQQIDLSLARSVWAMSSKDTPIFLPFLFVLSKILDSDTEVCQMFLSALKFYYVALISFVLKIDPNSSIDKSTHRSDYILAGFLYDSKKLLFIFLICRLKLCSSVTR